MTTHSQKIAIVGGSSGIGLKLAEILINSGNEVIIAARNLEKLQELKTKLGQNAQIYQLNANNEQKILEFAENIGEIDHLVVTLRGFTVNKPFIESDTAETRKAFEEKFWSQYYLTGHCLKNIKDSGSIVLTSGIASQRGYKGSFWQSAVCGAVESLVKSLACEVAPIRINAVSPGFVERFPNDTERFEAIHSVESNFPLNRLATQQEIAEGYIFLMQNRYITGNTLVIDGGTLS